MVPYLRIDAIIIYGECSSRGGKNTGRISKEESRVLDADVYNRLPCSPECVRINREFFCGPHGAANKNHVAYHIRANH